MQDIISLKWFILFFLLTISKTNEEMSFNLKLRKKHAYTHTVLSIHRNYSNCLCDLNIFSSRSFQFLNVFIYLLCTLTICAKGIKMVVITRAVRQIIEEIINLKCKFRLIFFSNFGCIRKTIIGRRKQ